MLCMIYGTVSVPWGKPAAPKAMLAKSDMW